MTFLQVLATAGVSLTIGVPCVLAPAPADSIHAVVEAMATEGPSAPLHEGAEHCFVQANLQ